MVAADALVYPVDEEPFKQRVAGGVGDIEADVENFKKTAIVRPAMSIVECR